MQWVEREDGDLDLMAVGSVGGKPRREIVATLHHDCYLCIWEEHYVLKYAQEVVLPSHDTAAKDAEAGTAPVAEEKEPAAVVPGGSAENGSAAAASGEQAEHEKPKADEQPVAPAAVAVPPTSIPAVEPVPLAAVAQPLPGDEKKGEVANGYI